MVHSINSKKMHNFLPTFPSNYHQQMKNSGCHQNRSSIRLRSFFPSTIHFPTLLIALLAILMAAPIQCSPSYWLMNGDGGNDQQQQFVGQSNFGAQRHRRLFRLADFVQPSSIGRQFYGQQISAKRQMKDSSSSMSGFAKMDALKNNMMRALINLRRYRRSKSEDWMN